MPRGSILIVRAQPSGGTLLPPLLREHDFAVTEITFGNSAENGGKAAYDLVIYQLDESIAGRCAPEDLRVYGNVPSLAIIPGSANYEYLLSCLECGMGHFLAFPFGRRSLLRRIEDIIDAGKIPSPYDDEKLSLLVPHGKDVGMIEMGKRQLVDFIVSSLENSIYSRTMLRRSCGTPGPAGEAGRRAEKERIPSPQAQAKIALEQELIRGREDKRLRIAHPLEAPGARLRSSRGVHPLRRGIRAHPLTGIHCGREDLSTA